MSRLPAGLDIKLDALGRVVLDDLQLDDLSKISDLTMAGGLPNTSCTNPVSCGGTSNGSCSNQLSCEYSSNGRCV
jgi:hypothetical protein